MVRHLEWWRAKFKKCKSNTYIFRYFIYLPPQSSNSSIMKLSMNIKRILILNFSVLVPLLFFACTNNKEGRISHQINELYFPIPVNAIVGSWNFYFFGDDILFFDHDTQQILRYSYETHELKGQHDLSSLAPFEEVYINHFFKLSDDLLAFYSLTREKLFITDFNLNVTKTLDFLGSGFEISFPRNQNLVYRDDWIYFVGKDRTKRGDLITLLKVDLRSEKLKILQVAEISLPLSYIDWGPFFSLPYLVDNGQDLLVTFPASDQIVTFPRFDFGEHQILLDPSINFMAFNSANPVALENDFERLNTLPVFTHSIFDPNHKRLFRFMKVLKPNDSIPGINVHVYETNSPKKQIELGPEYYHLSANVNNGKVYFVDFWNYTKNENILVLKELILP